LLCIIIVIWRDLRKTEEPTVLRLTRHD
jgi:hypothetical protein